MQQVLKAIVKDAASVLSEASIPFSMVGGLAVGARIGPRFTHDADLAVSAVNDEQAEQIAHHMLSHGYELHTELDHAVTHRLMALRLIAPRKRVRSMPASDPPLIDILFSSCGIEPEIVQGSTPAPIFPGLRLPTARHEHLIAMKLVSESEHRLQDRIDIQKLLQGADANGLNAVPALLDLIIQRGYSRGRDLHGSFAKFKASADMPREPWDI